MSMILDAHGLLVFLEKENGYSKVQDCLYDAMNQDEPLLMTMVNWGEVYYIVLRECGIEKVEQIELLVHALPIELVPVDRILAQEAARIKAFKKMSYADCFAAALTKINSGMLITGDPEFKAVSDEIEIMWLP